MLFYPSVRDRGNNIITLYGLHIDLESIYMYFLPELICEYVI